MSKTLQLFDLTPFTASGARRDRTRRPRYAVTGLEVRSALARLKQTLDTVPAKERERRERDWESLKRNWH